MAHMEQLVKAFNNDGIVIEKITTETAIYNFGFTDLNFTLCMGEDCDKEGNKKSEYFIPISLRSGDCFDKGENVYKIDYIYRKKNNEKLYEHAIYSSEEDVVLNEEIRMRLKL